jgi:hypothetical protein
MRARVRRSHNTQEPKEVSSKKAKLSIIEAYWLLWLISGSVISLLIGVVSLERKYDINNTYL